MLSLLWAAIEAELVAMGAHVTTLGRGKREVTKHDPPPRMIVYWTDDSFGPPTFVGGNPKAIKDVIRNCVLVIHGETEDHVEGMRGQFILALHKACKGSGAPNSVQAGRYVLGRGTVNTRTVIAKNGVEYTLIFSVPAAITVRKWTPGIAPLPSTYTGPQDGTYAVDGKTYAAQAADTVIGTTVGVAHAPPDDDLEAVTFDVTKEEE